MTKATTRLMAALALLAALSFLAPACGAGSAHNELASLGNGTHNQSSAITESISSGQSGPTKAQLLTYAECMRSHGLGDFPDPVPAPWGGYVFQRHATTGNDLDRNSPQFLSATQACRKDVPPSIANLTPAEMAANALRWSECMRSHGEPGFPAPNGRGLIKITNPTGIMDPYSPQFLGAEKACRSAGAGSFDVEITSGSDGPGGPSSGP